MASKSTVSRLIEKPPEAECPPYSLNIWETLPGDKTFGQTFNKPLDDYANLKNYLFPDFSDKERYKPLAESIKKNGNDKFILAMSAFSLIHRLEYLRGHENAMMDPYQYPDELHELLGILTELSIKSLPRLAEIGVDGIISYDDWGHQDRAIMSPETFREFFKPEYIKFHQAVHRHGMLAFMHSCGYITELLDDMIGSGLDVIQMDQQKNMGVENLGKRFGGRICFWCPVDIQHVMPFATLNEIESYAENLIDTLGKFNGGFIAKYYPSPEAVGHTPEQLKTMCDAFVKYGKYK